MAVASQRFSPPHSSRICVPVVRVAIGSRSSRRRTRSRRPWAASCRRPVEPEQQLERGPPVERNRVVHERQPPVASPPGRRGHDADDGNVVTVFVLRVATRDADGSSQRAAFEEPLREYLVHDHGLRTTRVIGRDERASLTHRVLQDREQIALRYRRRVSLSVWRADRRAATSAAARSTASAARSPLGDRRGRDAGQRAGVGHQPGVELSRLCLGVAELADVERRHEQAFRIGKAVVIRAFRERGHELRAGHEEPERQGRLQGDESHPHAALPRPRAFGRGRRCAHGGGARRGDRRTDPEGHGGRRGDRQREREHAPVDLERHRQDPLLQAEAPVGQHQAGGARKEGDEQALGQDLPHDSPPRAAEGETQAPLQRAPARARQHQVRRIHAGDRQHDHRNGHHAGELHRCGPRAAAASDREDTRRAGVGVTGRQFRLQRTGLRADMLERGTRRRGVRCSRCPACLRAGHAPDGPPHRAGRDPKARKGIQTSVDSSRPRRPANFAGATPTMRTGLPLIEIH